MAYPGGGRHRLSRPPTAGSIPAGVSAAVGARIGFWGRNQQSNQGFFSIRMKQSLLLLSVALAVLWTTCQSGFGAVDDHRLTILFSATGFTNLTGDVTARHQGATKAARYLARRKLSELLGKPGKSGAETSVGPDFLDNHLEIIETAALPTGDGSSELTGVRIFGKLEIDSPPTAGLSLSSASPALLQPHFSTEKLVFSRGEQIVFSITGNRDFYACILDRNDQGEIIQLLPNALRTDNHFAKDRSHRFPDPARGDNFNLEVSPPFGREQVYFIASDRRLHGPLESPGQALFATGSGSIEALLEQLVANQLGTLKSQERSSFATTQISTRKLSLQTRERD